MAAINQQLADFLGAGITSDEQAARIHIKDAGTTFSSLFLVEQDDETVQAIAIRNASGGDYDWGLRVKDDDSLQFFDITGGVELARLLSSGYFLQPAPASSPTDGDMDNNQVSMFLDEVLDELKFRGRYSDGTTLRTFSLGIGGGSGGSLFISGVDLKTIAQTSIFVVPSGKRFVIDTAEVIIDSATAVTVLPTIQFGILGDPDAVVIPTVLDSSMSAADQRQVFSSPSDAFPAGADIEFGVTVGATATAHTATVAITGYLVEL